MIEYLRSCHLQLNSKKFSFEVVLKKVYDIIELSWSFLKSDFLKNIRGVFKYAAVNLKVRNMIV